MNWPEDSTKKILVVDDEPGDQLFVASSLAGRDYTVVYVDNVVSANEEIEKSLRTGPKFDLALVDLCLGEDSGGEFARRLIDIIKNINVIILTGFADPAAILSFPVDDIIIKNLDQRLVLSETVARLVKNPLRLNHDPPDVTLNLWLATQKMRGLNSLKMFTRRVDVGVEGEVEKNVSIALVDRNWVSTVIYSQQEERCNKIINIAVSSLIGCPGRCQFCLNWRNKKNKKGLPVPFERVLLDSEIIGQVYLAINSPKIKAVLGNDSDVQLVVNFTCEGDGFVYNLYNCASAIRRLSEISKPLISFIITSIGSEKSLNGYIEKYLDLPRVQHYWSVNSLNQEIRTKLMPGTNGQSLEKMRDLYEVIAQKTEKPVTASWIVIRGITNQREDAERIAQFFNDRPFKLKLMALVKGSLSGVDNTQDEDVRDFEQELLRAGVNIPIRIRKILGANILSGCGNTIAADWKV